MAEFHVKTKPKKIIISLLWVVCRHYAFVLTFGWMTIDGVAK